jgi:hypothetical protein
MFRLLIVLPAGRKEIRRSTDTHQTQKEGGQPGQAVTFAAAADAAAAAAAASYRNSHKHILFYFTFSFIFYFWL